MVWSRWWYHAKSIAQTEPNELGVYELGDEHRNTVYYGKGKIKSQLLDHLNKRECPKARAYRFELFNTDRECEAREEASLNEYKRIHGKLPMYNERL